MEGSEHTAGSNPPEGDDVEEVLDGEIVEVTTVRSITAQERTVTRAATGWNAAPVQTAVAAATGFIAGAATLALLRHYGLARAAARELDLAGEEQLKRGGETAQTRGATYLVSIRTLQPPR